MIRSIDASPDVPAYLTPPVPPRAGGPEFGRLCYEDGYYLIEDALPAVCEFAKRLFPGCVDRSRHDRLRFRATRRAVGDVNLLLLRYPLTINDPDRYASHLSEATEHAVRREANTVLAPVTPPASFTGELLDFQAEGVAYLQANPRTLLADDMGLGKTVEAIAALATVGAYPVLVVAPPNVQIQWQRQLDHFLVREARAALFDTGEVEPNNVLIRGRTPYDLPPRAVYVIHYGLLHDWVEPLLEMGLKTIIFDEIQELRHTGTLKYSAASLLASAAEYVWGLSGTPIHNYGDEIWSVTNILDFNCLGNHDSFTREWCTGYGTKTVQNPEVLHDHLQREGLMLRRRKADVQSQLPPKRRIVHVVDHDEDVYAKLIANAQELAGRYETIQGWKARGEAAVAIDRASRRAAGLSKAPYVAQFVRSLIEAGERPLVYAWHHDVHDAIAAGLSGHVVAGITGKQNQTQKDAAVTAFAKGNIDALLLSLRATAGLDGLQGTATCVVFAEMDWSPAIHSQCEDRVHRIGIGEIDSVLCYYLVSETGHDGVVMDALGLKIGQFTGIMGDTAETQADRVLAQRDGEKHLGKIIERLRQRSLGKEPRAAAT